MTTMQIPPAQLPIVEDDATLEAMLEDASWPALLMSVVHVTGDTSLLRGDIQPSKPRMNQLDGGLSPDEILKVRALALQALKDYRDRGCTLPPQPTAATICEMLSFVAGEPISEEYVPVMLEELALDGRDSRAPEWTGTPPQAREHFHVLIIGAGMSGLLQGLRLKQAGIPFTIFEKNPSVGGTWYENRYPGCRVDIASHFYSYSFDCERPWSEHFCQRDELLEYFQSFAELRGLDEHIRFETEVMHAVYDERRALWGVRARGRDGMEFEIEANAVVSAVGQLNRPRIPEIPGRDSFTGIEMHSADWDPEVDIDGKSVAVVGSGASALQVVPAIAARVGRLYVFQRSAPWMLPNPLYHEKVSPRARWLIQHVPYYGRWLRFLIFWPGTDGSLPSIRIDPEWPHQNRSVSAANDQMRLALVEYLQVQVGNDPELLRKVIPDFPAMGKRMLQDNGSWLRALKRPNVELVAESVNQIDATGIVGHERHFDVDVIIYATGFYATRFLWPMRIVGEGGRRLDEIWGDEPSAYLGMTVPGFPNFFMLYGPGTNLAHAGSIIFHSECQVRYITECIKTVLESGARAIACLPAAHEEYNRRLQAELQTLVWSHPKCDSWYRNSRGRVVTTSPWRLSDYWRWTRGPAASDYRLIS